MLGLGTTTEIDIILPSDRSTVKYPISGIDTTYPVYYDGESVIGKCYISLKNGKKLEHQGIRIEFIGQIDLFYDRGHHHDFTSLSQELAAPGEINQALIFDFEFNHVEKQYESYQGLNVKLRFLLFLITLYILTPIEIFPQSNHPTAIGGYCEGKGNLGAFIQSATGD